MKLFFASFAFVLCAFGQISFAIPLDYVVTTTSGASIVPGTTDRLLHVIVGPYNNVKDTDAVKKKLENEGFKPIVKR